jgi:purine-binding chemotaxis protein CheW
MTITETAQRRSDRIAVHDVVSGLAGKYMSFKLDSEEYGIEILRVRELIRLMEITRVPGTKPFIRGVINLRGRVIPVVDLRLKFRMDEFRATDQTVIIVVVYEFRGQALTMGVLVDEVLEVLDIDAVDIEPPPDFGTGAIDTEYILGMGKSGKRVVLLLDIGRVLSAEESSSLGEIELPGEE